MKLSFGALVTALCWSCRLTAAANSYVYTVDSRPRHNSWDGQTPWDRLSPEVARLVLAHRAGTENFHGPNLEDEKAVKAMNDFGSSSRRGLFGIGKVQETLVLLEGEDKPLDGLLWSPHFTIEPSPSANATRGLFLDLARQAAPTELNKLRDDELYTLLKGGVNQRDEHRNHRIAVWSKKELDDYLWESTQLSDGIDLISITVIVTPSSGNKGDKNADYGTYAMPPSTQSPLRKRQQSPSEQPLEVSPTNTPPTTHNTLPVSSLADSSDPLPGILPACFPSQSSCESMTRNCSGHGTCGKKYTDANSPDDSRFKNCYACQCKADIKEDGNGRVSTTYWGGPACQKQDVSVQFWLIALFTVGLVGLVSFAVGQVWSMGEEELPSVIGAGVSGPVKRS